jgi:hypothetical protein
MRISGRGNAPGVVCWPALVAFCRKGLMPRISKHDSSLAGYPSFPKFRDRPQADLRFEMPNHKGSRCKRRDLRLPKRHSARLPTSSPGNTRFWWKMRYLIVFVPYGPQDARGFDMIRCKPGYEWDAIIVFFSTRTCPSSDPLRPAHSVGKLRPYVEFNAQTASGTTSCGRIARAL